MHKMKLIGLLSIPMALAGKAESKPDGWDDYWNSGNCPVVWGYRGEE